MEILKTMEFELNRLHAEFRKTGSDELRIKIARLYRIYVRQRALVEGN